MIVYMVEDDSCDDHRNIACYWTREAAEARRKKEHLSHIEHIQQFYGDAPYRYEKLNNTFAVYEYEVLDG